MGDCHSKNKVEAVTQPTREIGIDARISVKQRGNQASVKLRNNESQTEGFGHLLRKPENGRSGK